MLRLRQDKLLWPGGRSKCLTLSFDDGTEEDKRICGLLRKYKLKATFNLNPGLFGQEDKLIQSTATIRHCKIPKEEIAEIYQDFEIAVHGYSHTMLGSVPTSMAAYEIVKAKAELESIIRSPVRGMAWPVRFEDNATGSLVECAKACGMSYARTTRRTYSFVGIPKDFLKWDAACSYIQPQLQEITSGFLEPYQPENMTEPYLLYVWGHGYEATGFEKWDVLESFFDQVANKEDIWYASNIEVYDYVCAAHSVVYSATGEFLYNPSRLDVWLCVDGKPLCIQPGATICVPEF